MGMELLGIVASFATVVSGFGWLMERSQKRSERMFLDTHAAVTKVETNLEALNKSLQDLRVYLPTNFVTKDELIQHMQSEERWHQATTDRLREIHDELSSLRYRSTNGHQ